MAIRDVVTRGFGNGTFSPGVSKVVTRGYSIAEPTVIGMLCGRLLVCQALEGKLIVTPALEGKLNVGCCT